MLYTSYLSKLRGLTEKYPSSIFIIISRINKIDLTKYNNVYWNIEFAPSPELFKRIKGKHITFEEYLVEYIKEKTNNKEVYNTINYILDACKDSKDVILVCYEKDYTTCHRKTLAELISLVSKNNIYKGEI